MLDRVFDVFEDGHLLADGILNLARVGSRDDDLVWLVYGKPALYELATDCRPILADYLTILAFLKSFPLGLYRGRHVFLPPNRSKREVFSQYILAFPPLRCYIAAELGECSWIFPQMC